MSYNDHPAIREKYKDTATVTEIVSTRTTGKTRDIKELLIFPY